MELVSDVSCVESRFSLFGDSVSGSARYVLGLDQTYIRIEIVLDALDRLLGDEAHVEARFHPFGDSATLGARLVHCLCQTYRRLGNSFKSTRWNYLVTWVMWNLVSICFETLLAFVQDWCTVCVERIIGSKKVLEALDETAR
jgi:hypothetical protein